MENTPKKKILIIEDDRSLQSALEETVSKEGFEVESAFDGEEGLRKIATSKPDLILLDIIIPRHDGFDVLDRIKKDEASKDIPVLILTNLKEAENVQKALDLGATTFMVKSDFSLKDIIQKIKENLN